MSIETVQLFRFRPLGDRLIDEIRTGQIYACPPANLNDPFDCDIDARAAVERALETGLDDARAERVQFIRSNFQMHDIRNKPKGIICFSLSMTNSLMWSHYAEKHTGVCLLYEFPADALSESYNSNVQDEFFLVAMAKVNYGNNYFTNWLTHGEIDHPEIGQPALNAAINLLLAKSQDWAYEKEYRIIMSNKGLVQLPDNALRQIAFGLRTPAEKRAEIVANANSLAHKVRFCEARRDLTNDFGLTFLDID